MEAIFIHLLNGFATALSANNLFAALAGGIMGMLIGAIAFYFSASPELFPQISSTPV